MPMSEKRNCWVVLCTNSKHGSGGYPIPLALVEGDAYNAVELAKVPELDLSLFW